MLKAKLLFKKTLISGFLILISCLGYSIEFKHITPLDGLNNGSINSIVQDSMGFMWFATFDGLIRYDGYSFENFKPINGDSTSIPSKQAELLYLSLENQLWIKSNNRELSKYIRENNSFVQYSFTETLDKDDYIIQFFDYKSHLIVLTTKGLFADLNPDDDELNLVNVLEASGNENHNRFDHMDTDGESIFLYDFDTDKNQTKTRLFSAVFSDDPNHNLIIKEKLEVPFKLTRMVSVDWEIIYFASENGLVKYIRSQNKFELIEKTQGYRVKNLYLSSNNSLWFGTRNSGLGCLDLHSGDLTIYKHNPSEPESILGDVIRCIYEDFSGNIWIGHQGVGCSIYNTLKKPFETFSADPNQPHSLASNSILCFCEVDKKMLIGTYHHGLSLMEYDPVIDKNVFHEIALPEHIIVNSEYPSIWCMTKESDSITWLGTNFGLIKVRTDLDEWQFTQYLNDADNYYVFRQIYIDSNGNMWLGSYSGLYLICNSARDSMTPFIYKSAASHPKGLSDDIITSILHDREDRFWIGTVEQGICLLNTKYQELNLSGDIKPNLEFIYYKADKPGTANLNNNEINFCYEMDEHHLWFGTQGGGINILDTETGIFSHLSTAEGLPGEDVFGMLPDEAGKFWLSTNKGLSCYDHFEGTFTNFTPSDGIQGYIFMINSYFKSSNNIIYFGGRNGFTCFDPAMIHKNTIAPKVQLTELSIYNKIVKIGDTIHKRVVLPEALSGLDHISLSYKDNTLGFVVSVMHYDDPSKNIIQYKLEGIDRAYQSVSASNQRIFYSNLNPGNYLLHIRGGNSDNVFTSKEVLLAIEICPPWYKTIFAIIVFILLVIFIFIGIIRLLLNRQRLVHSLNIEQLEKENIQKINESKLRFFTNISHELKTPITLITAPIEDLLQRSKYSDAFLDKQLKLINRNANHLLRLINQVTDLRRLEANKLKLNASENDLAKFIGNIIMNFESLRQEKHIDLSVNLPEADFPLWFDHRKMEHIIYNLVSNAYKYVNKTGGISISLTKSDGPSQKRDDIREYALFSVFNTGKAIPAEKLDLLFERFFRINHDQEGAGIGLSMAKSLVELHHGSIEVHSIEGEGTTFNVFLPIGNNHLSDNECTSEKVIQLEYMSNDAVEEYKSAPFPIPMNGSKQLFRLLFVEDNSELRDFIRELLNDKYELYEARDGVDGFQIAQEIIPDIILSDIAMPEMDGYQLCEKIKETPSTCHIPVILLTAKNSPENEIIGFSSGADAYVTKPFNTRVLAMQISRLIKNRELVQKKLRETNYGVDIKNGFTRRDAGFILKIREIIEENMFDSNFNVNILAKTMCLSKTQIYRKVKALTGQSPVELIREIRLIKAADLILSSNICVKEACYQSGFNNVSYFVKCFKVKYGVTPSMYYTHH